MYDERVQMETWGSVFVDDGQFGAPFEPLTVVGSFHLSIDFLDQVVDRRYHKELIVRDARRLAELEANIRQHGILEPGILTYDHSRIRLQDGNHRYICAVRIGLEKFPVELRRVSHIQAPGIAIEAVLPDLLGFRYGV